MNNIWILAQTETGQTTSGIYSEPVYAEDTETAIVVSDPNAPASAVPASRGPFGGSSFIFLILMFVVMYFILFRGPRKKQQKHQQMVKALKKNDRVRTIGGIIGTVVDIKDDEITLKVDESNNTKIKIASTAIGKNLLENEA